MVGNDKAEGQRSLQSASNCLLKWTRIHACYKYVGFESGDLVGTVRNLHILRGPDTKPRGCAMGKTDSIFVND